MSESFIAVILLSEAIERIAGKSKLKESINVAHHLVSSAVIVLPRCAVRCDGWAVARRATAEGTGLPDPGRMMWPLKRLAPPYIVLRDDT